MSGSDQKEYLYIMVFENCVKVGITSHILGRIKSLHNSVIKEKIDFERSKFWYFKDKTANALEKCLINKYQKDVFKHEKVKRELFTLDTTDLLIKDVEDFIKLFEINVQSQKIEDKFTFDGYEDGKIKLYYHNDFRWIEKRRLLSKLKKGELLNG